MSELKIVAPAEARTYYNKQIDSNRALLAGASWVLGIDPARFLTKGFVSFGDWNGRLHSVSLRYRGPNISAWIQTDMTDTPLLPPMRSDFLRSAFGEEVSAGSDVWPERVGITDPFIPAWGNEGIEEWFGQGPASVNGVEVVVTVAGSGIDPSELKVRPEPGDELVRILEALPAPSVAVV